MTHGARPRPMWQDGAEGHPQLLLTDIVSLPLWKLGPGRRRGPRVGAGVGVVWFSFFRVCFTGLVGDIPRSMGGREDSYAAVDLRRLLADCVAFVMLVYVSDSTGPGPHVAAQRLVSADTV